MNPSDRARSIHLPSIWESSPAACSYPSFQGELEVDVIIVGAGITGLSAALLLSQANKKVAILEAAHIGAGTSGATTAHLTAAYDTDYQLLEQAYGTEVCQSVCRSLNFAIDLCEKWVDQYKIDCQFERITGYYYAETAAEVETIQKELEPAKRAGLDCQLTRTIPLPFSSRMGLEIKRQARLHALAYLQGLARAVTAHGGLVFEKSRVLDYSSTTRPVRVQLQGGEVRGQAVILATHTPLGKSLLHSALEPWRSYVLAFQAEEEVADALYWDAVDPYHYTRLVKVGNKPLLLVGGADRKTGTGGERAALDRLTAYVRQRYPSAQIVQGWSGQFYEPVDHLPFIGPFPTSEYVYVGTGYSGDGITLGTLAGWMLSQRFLGMATPYDKLYRPARLRTSGLGKLAQVNWQVGKTWVKDLLAVGQPSQDLDSLLPEHGCTAEYEGRAVAAYRSATGRLQMFSADCPHLHCNVRWNQLEKSFDCPCHGSRFATDGTALEGPSLQRLHELDLGELKKAQ